VAVVHRFECISFYILPENNLVGHWPWMSSIGSFDETTNLWEHQCGGSLISNKHFLSAAHCFKKEYNYSQLINYILTNQLQDRKIAMEIVKFNVYYTRAAWNITSVE
jgi:secreted trypsin-like serine protease